MKNPTPSLLLNRTLVFVGSLITAGILILGGQVSLAKEAEEMKMGQMRVSFAGASDTEQAESKVIIKKTMADFREIFHMVPGTMDVVIRFTDKESMGEMVRFEEKTNASGRKMVSMQLINVRGLLVWSPKCQIQGLTFGKDGKYEIKISKERRGSLGRVLSHEVGHVLVRQTFGVGSNETLNEGIAEYLARMQFPYEVHQSLNDKEASKDMKPYTEGYRFCTLHARDPGFTTFFLQNFDSSIETYDALEKAWKESN